MVQKCWKDFLGSFNTYTTSSSSPLTPRKRATSLSWTLTPYSLHHIVHRKTTKTSFHLNVKSHHHPARKQSVLSTLMYRAKAICKQDNLPAEPCTRKVLTFLCPMKDDMRLNPPGAYSIIYQCGKADVPSRP
jgi:hypothetical protein